MKPRSRARSTRRCSSHPCCTRRYPRSANTYDSLGEALLAAGRRDEAIAAYRRAVAIDPEFGSSVQALRRLGVQ